MYCPKCGTQNSNDSKICRRCLYELPPLKTTETGNHTIFQTPLRQAGEPNLTIHPDSEKQGNPTAGYAPESVAPLGFFRRSRHRSDITSVEITGAGRYWKNLLTGVLVLASVAIVSVVGVLLFTGTPNSDSANEMFSAAEKINKTGNFTQALMAYQKFVATYPDNPLTGVARERIDQIQQSFEKQKRQAALPRINALLEKATAAFSNQRYSQPENDNVILYTTELLELDPLNNDALILQAKVVSHYQDAARQAVQRRVYDKALSFYRIIGDILPADSAISNRIAELEALANRR